MLYRSTDGYVSIQVVILQLISTIPNTPTQGFSQARFHNAKNIMENDAAIFDICLITNSTEYSKG